MLIRLPASDVPRMGERAIRARLPPKNGRELNMKVFLAALALSVSVSFAASAAPMKLDDQQMDEVTAGLSFDAIHTPLARAYLSIRNEQTDRIFLPVHGVLIRVLGPVLLPPVSTTAQ